MEKEIISNSTEDIIKKLDDRYENNDWSINEAIEYSYYLGIDYSRKKELEFLKRILLSCNHNDSKENCTCKMCFGITKRVNELKYLLMDEKE